MSIWCILGDVGGVNQHCDRNSRSRVCGRWRPSKRCQTERPQCPCVDPTRRLFHRGQRKQQNSTSAYLSATSFAIMMTSSFRSHHWGSFLLWRERVQVRTQGMEALPPRPTCTNQAASLYRPRATYLSRTQTTRGFAK